MNNQDFLSVLARSFSVFLSTGSRSNEKLKVLHGAIARDLSARLGVNYNIRSLGFGIQKESSIQGRYIDKMVDITVLFKGKPIAGIGVKFVMQNYSQNSNNYFENMLGETANIRSNRIPYFQVFVIPDTLPYYDKDNVIKNWEHFSSHNVSKYLTLSQDSVESMIHTPTKTLLYVIHLPDVTPTPTNKQTYVNSYMRLPDLQVRPSTIDYGDFGNSVVYNDYETFIQKVVHYILSC